MRTTLFVILALLLAGGGFSIYLKLQGPVARLKHNDAPPDPISLDPNAPRVNGVASGDQPWSKKFDSEGRLTYKFRSSDVEPRGNGKVHVTNPVAEFYQYVREKDAKGNPHLRTQLVEIHGKTGDMEIQESNNKLSPTMQQNGGGAAGSAPRRGRLNDVLVKLYHDIDDRRREQHAIPATQPTDRAEPMMTLKSDNVVFDNETFELSTEAYRGPDGNIVAADQVPIIVTGDYDFRGRGLRMRWNQVDGRLEYLEVAHGEVLRINHPSGLQQTKPAPAAGPAASTAVTDAAGRPVELAVGDWDSVAFAQALGAARLVKSTPDAPPKPKKKTTPDAVPPPPKRVNSPKPKPEPKGPQPPYRATFFEQVRITQGQENVAERDVARADLMHVEFLPQSGGGKGSSSGASATTKPVAAAAPATPAASAAGPTSQPAVASAQSADTVAAADPKKTIPGTQPTTKPTDPDSEPIIVRWTGPLKVIPIDQADPDMPLSLKPGDSMLRLVAQQNPVVVTRQQSDALCAAMNYHSSDGSVLLHSSPQYPAVILTQYPAPGEGGLPSVVHTETLLYSSQERVALLSGKGRALMSAKDKPTTRPTGNPDGSTAVAKADDRLDARWTRSAKLFFSGSSPDLKEGMSVRHATLLGDVDIRHPQLKLDSQTLELAFDPEQAQQPAGASPTTRPSQARPVLRQVIATETVRCRLQDAEGKHQNIDCDRLTLGTATTPDGRMYPKLVNADGNTHAFDDKQDLRAGHLELSLAPAVKTKAARPTTRQADGSPAGLDTAAVELRTMIARDDVHVKSADGALASGSELYVNQIEGKQYARLVGSPLAEVIDAKKNIVRGPLITVDPDKNIATVDGRGSIYVTRQDNPNEAARPIEVAFLQGAEVNGPANRIWVRGPVAVVSADPDGTVNTATGNRVTIELADKPTTQPSKPAKPAASAQVAAPAPAPAPAAVPASASLGAASPAVAKKPAASGQNDGLKMDMMRDKEARVIILEQDAQVKSNLAADDGTILREFELKSNIIRYELQPSAQATSTPTTQPVNKPGRLVVPGPGTMLVRDHRPQEAKTANAADPNGGGSMRGAMAFQWTGGLIYDEGLKAASINQDVTIVQRPDDPKEPPARLDADHVLAWFEPKPKAAPTTQPATLPATQPATSEAVALQLKWLTARGHAVATREGSAMSADRIDYDPASFWMTATGTDRTPATFTDPKGTSNASADQILWNTQTWKVKSRNLGSRAAGPQSKTPAK